MSISKPLLLRYSEGIAVITAGSDDRILDNSPATRINLRTPFESF
jgi:hypothetical protein